MSETYPVLLVHSFICPEMPVGWCIYTLSQRRTQTMTYNIQQYRYEQDQETLGSSAAVHRRCSSDTKPKKIEKKIEKKNRGKTSWTLS